ncbi:MAG TPA: sialidase family protein [Polyangiaceae bacterium]|jgi:photosystem II stability/assembly factor-like uncharacterized protein
MGQLLSHRSVVVGGALLAVVLATGCTFYTSCPTGNNNNGTSSGGSSGSAGTSGLAGGANIPTGKWVNVTSNLKGMDSECGNLSGMSAKPDEDLLIAGVAQKGIWGSTDGGMTWAALGTDPSSDQITNRMSTVVYDPADTNRWWEVGTYNNNGAYETKDDGATLTGLPDTNHNDLISIDFSDPDRKTMVIGGHEGAMTLRLSMDGGQTWADIRNGLPGNTNCTLPLVIDAQTFLVGCGGYGGGQSGIWRTTDAGMTWAQVSTSGGFSPPTRAMDNSIYWVGPNGNNVTRSMDDGVTWMDVVGMGVVAGPALLELPDGRLATLGAQYLVISADRGATWAPVSSALPYPDSNRASGVVYSTQQKAFFIWHSTCGFNGPVPVPDDAIMRYDFDYTTN